MSAQISQTKAERLIQIEGITSGTPGRIVPVRDCQTAGEFTDQPSCATWHTSALPSTGMATGILLTGMHIW